MHRNALHASRIYSEHQQLCRMRPICHITQLGCIYIGEGLNLPDFRRYEFRLSEPGMDSVRFSSSAGNFTASVLFIHQTSRRTAQLLLGGKRGEGDAIKEQNDEDVTLSSSGEPSPPAVHGQRGMGKAYRLGLVKQDDGGMPIVEYIVKYKTVSQNSVKTLYFCKFIPKFSREFKVFFRRLK